MKIFNRIILAFLVSATAASSYAADADSEAGAVVVSPIQVANIESLYFGTIAPSTSAADVVTVAANGSKACGAELTCLSEDHTAARFTVAGTAGQVYTISLPSSAEISNSDGDTMTVNNFAGPVASATMSESGNDAFNLGGTLNLDANQAAGTYVGTFTVSVNYQ